jgi:hypothetical protein
VTSLKQQSNLNSLVSLEATIIFLFFKRTNHLFFQKPNIYISKYQPKPWYGVELAGMEALSPYLASITAFLPAQGLLNDRADV